jgi:hypothetical protein
MTGTQVSDGTSEQDHYLIRGGVAGRQRLRVLARVMWPTTRELLGRGRGAQGRALSGCGVRRRRRHDGGPDPVRAGPGRAPGGPGAARVRGVRPAPPVRRPRRAPVAGRRDHRGPCSHWTRRPSTSCSSSRCASRGCATARRRRCPPTRRSSTGCGGCPRLECRRAALVSFALRFDLVRYEHWPCCRPAWDRCDPLPYPWLNV